MVQEDSLIAEGKTKKIFSVMEHPHLVIVESKDDITAGDGARHDIMLGKAEWANATTCNIFQYLSERHFVATAYRYRYRNNSFVAHRCDMIPLEVVVRRRAFGSFLKRLPSFEEGATFSVPIVEFYLKTTDFVYGGIEFPYNDPLIRFLTPTRFVVCNAHRPQAEGYVELTLHGLEKAFALEDDIVEVARAIFLWLETEWKALGRELVDIKLEFGFDSHGKLRLADVVDNDSWRLLERGDHLDKQCYRNGMNLEEVARRYAKVAFLTEYFILPDQERGPYFAVLDQ